MFGLSRTSTLRRLQYLRDEEIADRRIVELQNHLLVGKIERARKTVELLGQFIRLSKHSGLRLIKD